MMVVVVVEVDLLGERRCEQGEVKANRDEENHRDLSVRAAAMHGPTVFGAYRGVSLPDPPALAGSQPRSALSCPGLP